MIIVLSRSVMGWLIIHRSSEHTCNSTLLLYRIPLYKQLTDLPFHYGHLGCFQFGSVKNNAAMKVSFGGNLYSFLLRTNAGIELLRHEVEMTGGSIFRRLPVFQSS